MNISGFVRRHPLRSYFSLAFAIAWIGVLLVAPAKFLRGEAFQLGDALLMFLGMLAGPSIAGTTLTGVVDGSLGLRDLFSRMGRWRVSLRWYSATLIFPILILVVLLALVAQVSPHFAPVFSAAGILIGLIAGFVEEIGWTGFAFPRMRVTRSPLVAAFLLGVIHSLWHLAADYLGSSGGLGAYWLQHFAMFMLSMTAMRILLVWVYVNSRSLLLAQLMHASSTGFLSSFVTLSLSPAENTLFYAAYSVVLWIAVAVVIVRNGEHLLPDPAKAWASQSSIPRILPGKE